MKDLIKQNPIVHWTLLINKLNNRANEIKDPHILALIEETKIVIQELIDSNRELEQIVREDNINMVWQL
jgi:hypothetical protein